MPRKKGRFNPNVKMTDAARKRLQKYKIKYMLESEADSENVDLNLEKTSSTCTVDQQKNASAMQYSEGSFTSEVSVKQEHEDVTELTTYPISKQEYHDIDGESTATDESNHYTVTDACKEELSNGKDGDSLAINPETLHFNIKTETHSLGKNHKRHGMDTPSKTPRPKKRRCNEKKIQYNLKPTKIPKICKSIGKPIEPKDRNPADLREAFYESCQVCFNDHSEESCPLKYYANVIDNNESLPVGYCMPSQVMLGTSKVHSDRLSLFARDDIPEFTKFGPLKGKLLTKEELKTIKRSEIDIEHFWPLHAAKENPTYIDSYINTTNPAESNWLRFLLPAPYDPTYSTFNMQRVVIENEIYFITTNDIKAGDELFMHAIEPPERIFFNMRALGKDEKAISNCSVCTHTNKHYGEGSILNYYRHKGSFISPLYFVRHYRMEHIMYPGSMQMMKLFLCSTCNMELDNGPLLRKHIEEVHTVDGLNKKSFMCSICRETFSCRTAIQLHRVAFHPSEGEGPKQCPHCDKILPNSVRLSLHKNVSHALNAQEVTCEICAKTFGNIRLVHSHIARVHKKTYGKICHECGRSFHDAYQLRVHSLTHSGLKPYQCDLQSVKEEGMCTYACTTKQWMQKHYKSTHGLSDDNMPKIERKFQF